jgi:hypothetical protein
MQVRGAFIGALVLVVVGVAAALGVSAWRHHSDQQELHAALALAHRLQMPISATSSNECHGDGLVACWVSPNSSRAVAQAVGTAMRADGARASVRCNSVKVGFGPAQQIGNECTVIARFGRRATAAMATPSTLRRGHNVIVVGTLVSVSAA